VRRAFVIVIDACGAGELPDSAEYGDAGANTLGHVAEAAGGLDLPVMTGLGLGNIMPLVGAPPVDDPVVHGRLHPLGPGKDTITGHWELMGVVTPVALRTYPEGFPDEVLDALRAATGRGILCNRPYSGTEVIEAFGEEHMRTGALIVYTSADSVLQIAAHEDVVPLPELYAACDAAREIMTGEHAVGRVIARPFRGEPGHFARTEGRRDVALNPPARSYLDELQASGVPVHTVGKIGQVFGHRNDVEGFHGALKEIDAAVGEWLERLDPSSDLLVITADHGVDPTHPGTDHTREHVPLLARFAGHGGRRHDGPFGDVGASVLRWLAGRDAPELPGTPFT
jgi:phosphopentomutase